MPSPASTARCKPATTCTTNRPLAPPTRPTATPVQGADRPEPSRTARTSSPTLSAQQTLPTTTSPPTTSVVTSTTIAAPSVPPTDPDLASQIPVVDGYSIAEMPAGDVLWKLFDSSLPGEFTRHHALVVAADGVPVAHLVVAATTGDRPAIDTFVEHTFADDVFLPADSVETDDGVFTTMNAAAPVWTEMEGNAVIVAEQEIDGNFQWAWSADDAVWIVRGKRDAENYVRALLQLHAPTLDPYDQQGMTGDLFDHTPSTPGYQYWDFPRDVTLDSLSATGFGDCAERFYLGYILPDGVTAEVVDNNLLWLGLEKAAGRCVEDGVLEDVAADIASGRQAEQIGGLTVYRDEQTHLRPHRRRPDHPVHDQPADVHRHGAVHRAVLCRPAAQCRHHGRTHDDDHHHHDGRHHDDDTDDDGATELSGRHQLADRRTMPPRRGASRRRHRRRHYRGCRLLGPPPRRGLPRV